MRWAHVCPKSELLVPGAMKGINSKMEDDGIQTVRTCHISKHTNAKGDVSMLLFAVAQVFALSEVFTLCTSDTDQGLLTFRLGLLFAGWRIGTFAWKHSLRICVWRDDALM